MKLSVITPTFNAGRHLPAVLADLEAQTCKDFEWIVADGGSTDDTLQIAGQALGFPVVISAQRDFGIYDAINRGLGLASGEFYLVLGADDRLYGDAVARFLATASASSADIISAGVDICGRTVRAKRCLGWFHGIRELVASHSVGAAIRCSLHDRVGLYSRKFPICADQLFFLKAKEVGARFEYPDFVAGRFNLTGVTGLDAAGFITETFRVNLIAGRAPSLQMLLLLLRLLKNFMRLSP